MRDEDFARRKGRRGVALLDADGVKRPVQHALSKEQQQYYEHVTAAVKSPDTALRRAALASLSSDAGLRQLAPYMVQFVADEVARAIRLPVAGARSPSPLPALQALMQTANAVLENPYIHIEPYLHQLMPTVLSCVLGKRLCLSATEDHWSLRRYAARIAASVCRRFGHAYEDLLPRITKTLMRYLVDPQQPLTTHYGAIVGLAALGRRVTQALLLPQLQLYMVLLEGAMQEGVEPAKRTEARQVYHALLTAVGEYLRGELDGARATLQRILDARREAATATKHARPAAASARTAVAAAAAAAAVAAAASVASPDVPVPLETLADLFGEDLLPFLVERAPLPLPGAQFLSPALHL
jgi:transcription initiation factor TFIID subunit 6